MTIQDITVLPDTGVRYLPNLKIYNGPSIYFSNDLKKKERIKSIDAINTGDIVFISVFLTELYAGIITEKNGDIANCTVRIANSTLYCVLEFGKDDRLCWVNTNVCSLNNSAILRIRIN